MVNYRCRPRRYGEHRRQQPGSASASIDDARRRASGDNGCKDARAPSTSESHRVPITEHLEEASTDYRTPRRGAMIPTNRSRPTSMRPQTDNGCRSEGWAEGQ